ncbi:MAG TPA: B12-binding domain-containing radical SAM protein, partial [Geobacteraceae bacterium]|nr:B12-binding domain-containing radical SAM protein [Geobacteraceae bacterium]
MEAHEIPLRAESLSVIMERVRYRVTLPSQAGLDLPHLVERFLTLETCPFRREKKGKSLELDLRHELAELTAHGNSLEMLVARGKPLEFAAAITGLSPAELADARIEKLAVVFRN